MPKRKLTKPISGAEYARRRRELMALMEENSIAILPSANEKVRNGDVPYRFRQDSDFQYLTGFNEPESVIVLIPGREHGEALLFCRDRDDEHEKWHGPIIGPDRAKQFIGVDDAFPISDIDDILPGLIEGRSKLYSAMGSDSDFDHQIFEWVDKISESGHLGASPPGEFVQLEQYLHELRLYKSAAEIELMRRAAQASAAGHVRAMEVVRPGMMEYELEAELRYAFSRSGARDEAYPSIVGGGENACVMHYIENNQMLRDGDLVLVDAGCEFEGYASDLTRTYPINGRFSAEQKAVYEVVLKAQEAAIDAVQPGNTWDEPHDAAMWEITKGLIALGILKGDLEVLFEDEAYMPYCMHKTGHWLGLDVHDVGDYQVNDQWRVLEPGMVTTIEPGLYFDASLESLPVAYRGIGVRIEDDVLVTKSGHDVLTDAAPKTVREIEALMQNELEVRSHG